MNVSVIEEAILQIGNLALAESQINGKTMWVENSHEFNVNMFVILYKRFKQRLNKFEIFFESQSY